MLHCIAYYSGMTGMNDLRSFLDGRMDGYMNAYGFCLGVGHLWRCEEKHSVRTSVACMQVFARAAITPRISRICIPCMGIIIMDVLFSVHCFALTT